ncbi:MAG: 4-(cytidine 5'-diphospho)-2-C-methyl-D-erythritol kinase [Spirochaetaceae bacterium]|jgi:4-diphosphocytidyl-2-C-methyl-D-erythritol kinase|nr:4-(cytidine 5'-diphospho)-2-C-methyl-D-erythritol kinase [Spirochaetaceae bacterium]
MPGRITIDAPCKINLYLWVGECRADGFHDIESLFAALSLRDTLDFELVRGAGNAAGRDEVYVETTELPPPFDRALAALPPEKNLVYHAIKLFKRETGFDRAVRARVYKRIPAAAGLGGASSDAAAALLAMKTLSGAEIFPQRLRDIAAELGSDVPFFAGLTGEAFVRDPVFQYSAAFVRGRGELVEAAAAPPLNIVIVNPGIESGTKEAFDRLDAYRLRYRSGVDGSIPPQKTYSSKDLPAELAKSPSEWRFTNDFLPVFLETEPVNHVYTAVLRDIERCGALFCGLSGSGASCFGVFTDSHSAADAATRLAPLWPFVRATASVVSGSA